MRSPPVIHWDHLGMIVAKRTRIGPRHHGRKMSLRAFEFAKTEDGWAYELAREYVVVTEVPNFPHARQALLSGSVWIITMSKTPEASTRSLPGRNASSSFQP